MQIDVIIIIIISSSSITFIIIIIIIIIIKLATCTKLSKYIIINLLNLQY